MTVHCDLYSIHGKNEIAAYLYFQVHPVRKKAVPVIQQRLSAAVGNGKDLERSLSLFAISRCATSCIIAEMSVLSPADSIKDLTCSVSNYPHRGCCHDHAFSYSDRGLKASGGLGEG